MAVVSTFAGTGSPGFADGANLQAAFNGPNGMALDATGNVLVADRNNKCIRLISPAGGALWQVFKRSACRFHRLIFDEMPNYTDMCVPVLLSQWCRR